MKTKEIIRRLNKLEAQRHGGGDGLSHWTAKYWEVRRRAFAPMSPAESVWLNDLYAVHEAAARQASIEAHRERWDRFENAFNSAVKEVPAPHVMCIADLFGEW
jgi:hypothetical protein